MPAMTHDDHHCDFSPPYQVLWDFVADDFPLPESAGIGRVQRFDFGSELALYRSEFRVTKDCVIDCHSDQKELAELLCSIFLLTGTITLETPDRQQHLITPQSGLLFRVQDIGSRFIIPGGQTVRHIGVANPMSILHKRLGDQLPEGLANFATVPEGGTVNRRLPVQSRLRGLLTDVFSPVTCAGGSPTQELQLEAVAWSIFAESVRLTITCQDNSSSQAPLWGEQVFNNITVYLRENLERPLKGDDICQRFGVSKRQLHQLFQTMQQCSPREFLRRERLNRARALLEQTDMPVKSAAYAVGYVHVSNFSKAYRAFFGETPGQTQRLNSTGGSER
ncbi:helix-turn-helix domain-containing protein [Gilvimarinus sp. 1_MG-2023]|uniref:helix-turn-helix domain-containing protein n=1 Tax=Gilvimarinus sp. 1_MG-2023 TaxID=3062638 RepID=UPI0026E3F58A|nr:AraC family transcriptional regulator [Gilvimarinus sp. 1_MG-2023]MDO6746951.1 AraC family transcriptional regulator [Gilvimarinus sp. 1_MG-2023]